MATTDFFVIIPRYLKQLIYNHSRSRFAAVFMLGTLLFLSYKFTRNLDKPQYINVDSIADWEAWIVQLNKGQSGDKLPYGYQTTNCSGIDVCQYPDERRYRFIIQAGDDALGLHKTLLSLQPDPEANFVDFHFNIAMEIWINPDFKGRVHKEVLDTAVNFYWKMPSKRLHVHRRHVDDYGQFMHTWYPAPTSHEIALFLKEGYIVSKYFISWLNGVTKNFNTNISGYSLISGGDVVIASGPNAGLPLHAPDIDNVFLYQHIPRSAIALDPQAWRQFFQWVSKVQEDEQFKPYISGINETWESQQLNSQGANHGLWVLWYMYFAQEKNLFCVYPDLEGSTGDAASKLSVLAKTDLVKSSLLEFWEKSYVDFSMATPPKFAFNGSEILSD